MQPDDVYAEDTADWSDDGGLYVNFSDEEAASESKDYEPLPTGKYLVTITDVELRHSKSAKNPNKPMYSFEFTVIADKRGGAFVDRKCWALAMLFNPALFTITHIMKATGFQVSGGRVRIPAPEELIGKQLLVGGVLRGEQKDKDDPSKTYAPRFEPKYFAPVDKWESTGSVTAKTSSSSARSSLLS
jgi:hypothetical protein